MTRQATASGFTEAQLAEARTAAEVATARHPDLHANGFMTLGASHAFYPLLAHASGAEEIATAISFLRLFEPTKAPKLGSYGLKHAAEEWGASRGMSSYVSNGSLIAAAVYLGLVVSGPVGPNAGIGVTPKRKHQRMTPTRARQSSDEEDGLTLGDLVLYSPGGDQRCTLCGRTMPEPWNRYLTLRTSREIIAVACPQCAEQQRGGGR